MHKRLLNSPMRTMKASEADFFFVPFYASALLLAEGGAQSHKAVTSTHTLLLKALNRVKNDWPHWKKHDGADHVWAFTFDHGVCLGNSYRFRPHTPPSELRNSIFIGQYGHINDPTCFRKGRDIVMPQPLRRSFVEEVMPALQEHRPREHIYFKGSITASHEHGDTFSKGLRERLYSSFGDKSEFLFRKDTGVGRGRDMVAAKFCLSLPGFAPWSSRLIESVLAG